MKKILAFILSFVCLFFNDAEAQNALIDDCPFSKTALLKHIKTVSSDAFEGRRTGTKGAIKARKYSVSQFDSLQVFPLTANYRQPFKFVDNQKTYHATNILGHIKGTQFPNKHIVISAHYDHEGIKYGKIYNGADDNASGLSALFSFAEYFINHPPKHSVILAAFDSEELGLQGSKYFVNNPIIPLKDIVVNLNMDMISRSNVNELFVVGTSYNLTLKQIILNTNPPENIKLLTGHDGKDGREDWTHSSDHASFHKKGIPFLYFGVEDHKDYHEPTDDYENIHPEFYIKAVETIITVFDKIDGSSI